MKKRIGLIGLGHLGRWLITGWMNASSDLRFFVANRSAGEAKEFTLQHGCFFTTHNREAVEKSEIVILAIRPDQVSQALAGVAFTEAQTVVSVAAGVTLATLRPLVHPATVVRAMPVSCAAVNKSPVIIYPENPDVESLFSLVGRVHRLPDEARFTPGTALVGAFYAWMFLLMDEAAKWTVRQGIDAAMAREMVIETIEGACAMAADPQAVDLHDIWATLATPGGISAYGAKILSAGGGIAAWSAALEATHRRMLE